MSSARPSRPAPVRTEPVTLPADPRLVRVKRALDRHSTVAPPEPPGQRQAAVALILRSRADLELLLIKRAEVEGDPWSGHMALPGGRREDVDASLLDTAVRETYEETGVVLDTAAQHLGALSRLDPVSRRLPALSVSPFVFGVPGDTEAHTESREVEQVFWTPLPLLLDPGVAGEYRHQAEGIVRRFPTFDVHGQVVWGLTYRVLEEFLRLSSPPPSRR